MRFRSTMWLHSNRLELPVGLLVSLLCYVATWRAVSADEDHVFRTLQQFMDTRAEETGQYPKVHTVFSVECGPYFDWQTIGMMHSYRKSRQPGPITRLLSCTEEDLKTYPNMDLAPTLVVPSWTHNPRTGDWYPAVNKPKGVVDWVETSPDAKDVEWVVILDADQIIRGPITPWETKAEKGKPVAAYYGYLIGCDNILAQLHTKNPHLCDKVGGFIIMHIEDLRRFAPLWLSKTEEVRADRDHYATNITGDIYGQGWISEMYGYSFGAADCELRHKIDNYLMLYPGYEPMANQDVRLLHYGLNFGVGSWKFGKSAHHSDRIVNECNRIFDPPPFPHEVTETEDGKRRAAMLSIECVNTLNEGLLIHHATHGCPEPPPSPYITFLKQILQKAMGESKPATAAAMLRGTTEESMSSLAARFLLSTSNGLPAGKLASPIAVSDARRVEGEDRTDRIAAQVEGAGTGEAVTLHPPEPLVKHPPPPLPRRDPNAWEPKQAEGRPRMATLFSVECTTYFDWQTLGMMYSYKRSGQPGPVTRLLSCTEEALKQYRGLEMAPTMVVPSWNRHPVSGDWYPAINKPVAVNYWLKHSPQANEVDWVLILDADQILRKPILPWELGGSKGHPVSASYNYLIGCDNILGQLHMKNPAVCDKVGGYILMHIDDLRVFAPLWLSKTEEVRADKDHYATNITGDVYGQGWISEMYGYSFGASDAGLKHVIADKVMLYPGYLPVPKADPLLFHYGLPMKVLEYQWDKAGWRTTDLANRCGKHFPDPPDPSALPAGQEPEMRRRDLMVIECIAVLNRALREYHRRLGCPAEGEEDVGTADLGLASPRVPYEAPELKAMVQEGQVVEGVKTVKHEAYEGEEKGLFVTFERTSPKQEPKQAAAEGGEAGRVEAVQKEGGEEQGREAKEEDKAETEKEEKEEGEVKSEKEEKEEGSGDSDTVDTVAQEETTTSEDSKATEEEVGTGEGGHETEAAGGGGLSTEAGGGTEGAAWVKGGKEEGTRAEDAGSETKEGEKGESEGDGSEGDAGANQDVALEALSQGSERRKMRSKVKNAVVGSTGILVGSLEMVAHLQWWTISLWSVILLTAYCFVSSRRSSRVARFSAPGERTKGRGRLVGKAVRFPWLPAAVTLPMPTEKSKKDTTV